MKLQLQSFIEGLIPYDYMLFGFVLLLFILLIVLAILLRDRMKLAIFFVLLAFATFLLGPTVGYIFLHKYLFKNHTELISQKRLHFSPAIVVKGTITNDSKLNFSSCEITATVYKITSNKYKNYLFQLKPLKKMSILKKDILKGQTEEFKMIIEPFTYKKEYNISLGASCK